jgi:hypothetical protein
MVAGGGVESPGALVVPASGGIDPGQDLTALGSLLAETISLQRFQEMYITLFAFVIYMACKCNKNLHAMS